MIISKAKEKAVGYVRMSDPRQDGSPEQQRMELTKLAEEYDCEQIREYCDEGKSGSKDLHKRDGFNQMIQDAETINDFSVILVRDIDRFGRFGPQEANYYWHRLKKCGVRIISAAQGEIDTEELAGWLTASITQHGKHQFVKDLSRNVVGGYVRSAQNNKFSIVITPYGYEKQVFDENSNPVRVVKRTESFIVPKTWSSTLILGDPEEVEVIKWIFDLYAHRTIGLRSITEELNKKGLPSPQANSRRDTTGKWNQVTQRYLKKNHLSR